MSKVILAYSGCMETKFGTESRRLTAKKFPGATITKFDYDADRNNPIKEGVDAVVFYAHGRVVSKEAMKRVVMHCAERDIPLYIPCVHSLFPHETCCWTHQRVKHFERGVTTLEQMMPEDLAEIVTTSVIPCMTPSM